MWLIKSKIWNIRTFKENVWIPDGNTSDFHPDSSVLKMTIPQKGIWWEYISSGFLTLKKISLLFGVLFNIYYFLSSFLFFLSFLPPFCIQVENFHFCVFFGWSLDKEHWKTGAQRKCLRHLLATEAIPYLPCWKMRVKMATQLLSKDCFYQKERFISSTWYQSLGNDQLTPSLWDM